MAVRAAFFLKQNGAGLFVGLGLRAYERMGGEGGEEKEEQDDGMEAQTGVHSINFRIPEGLRACNFGWGMFLQCRLK